MSSSFRLGLVFACLQALFVGCDSAPPNDLTDGTAGKPVVLNEGERLLAQMIDAYAKADSYSDRGELIIGTTHEGNTRQDKVPFATMLERPDKLHLQLYQGTFVCDGRNAYGWANDMPGFILKRPAPKVLTLAEVFADDVLAQVLTGGSVKESPALTMLLGSDVFEILTAGGNRPELMSDDYAAGKPCRRVRIRQSDGDLIYWIDAKSHVLRRLQYPTERLRRTMALSTPTPPSAVTLTAEFVDAELNTKIASETFAFEPPPQIKLVDKLSPLWAPPVPPSPLLGSTAEDFRVRKSDGAEITSASLRGKVAVLVFWSVGSSESLKMLEALDKAAAKFAGRDEVVFLPINIDPSGPGGFADADIRRSFDELKFKIPVVRDIDNSAVKAFEIRFQPNLFLLDKNGVLQDNEVGLSPQLLAELEQRIDAVAAGRSLVDATQRRFQQRRREYEAAQQSQNAAAGLSGDIPQAKLAAKSSPKSLKLAELWKSTVVKKPGYVLVTEEKQGAPRVIVADGLKAVAELDAQGKLLRSIPLDLPKEPEGVVSYYRTAVGKDGKRYFVGSLPDQQQLHLFDSDFKRLRSFPEGSHSGIADVQFGDIDGDGEPDICVGYWGLVGLQAVGLDGARKWTNRRLPENLMRLALTGPNAEGKRLILSSTGVMTVAVVDEKGETLKEMPVGERAVRMIAAHDLNGDGGVELCAIAAAGPGSDVAVGFDGGGGELWSYPLPPGVQPVPEMQNEMVVGGKLFDQGPGVWVFAAADGSIHIVGIDGKPLDSFAAGEAIHGLAVGQLAGRPALVYSGPTSVTAVRLELP